MIAEEDIEYTWKQYFPTYSFKERDIALEEYKGALQSLEAEERIFLNASNITLLAGTAIGSLIVGTSEKVSKILVHLLPENYIYMFFILIILTFSIVTLKYFADRQKSIIFSARKVIILRRMLGLSYGSLQLILPNWRVEGADQPLSVKLFPGWFTYIVYPFYFLSLISTTTILFLLLLFSKDFIFLSIPLCLAAIILLWILFLAYIYRKSLLDTHERFLLLFIKDLSKTIYLKLVDNFEYIIYRAKLATYETNRQKIELKNLKEILIFIEDKSFYKHYGVSLKGLGRAISPKIKSGGSTITQQVVRTLFIHELHKIIRRKIVEILLALWFEQVITKNEILEIYLASVRFEKGIFGILEAMEYFFGDQIKHPTKTQAFFLIERVSNIRSGLLFNKIIDTVKAAKQKELLINSDINELFHIYENAINERKIIAHQSDLLELKTGLLKL